MTDPSALLSEARLELARFPVLLGAMVAGLAPDRWRARPAPDEWAPVEIVCHLRDEEAEDFGARVRVVLEGDTRFAPIDPEGWATARRYHDADPLEALTAFRRHRRRASPCWPGPRPSTSRPRGRARPASGSRGSISSRLGSRTTGCTSASWRAR